MWLNCLPHLWALQHINNYFNVWLTYFTDFIPCVIVMIVMLIEEVDFSTCIGYIIMNAVITLAL